jgi:glycosyltransferase involved in cell wall biosynthesis
VLVTSHATLGERISGPAIRALEIAKALSHHVPVSLVAPTEPGFEMPSASGDLELIEGHARTWQRHLPRHDVVLSQAYGPIAVQRAQRAGVRIIRDAYDPVALERLEVARSTGRKAGPAELAADIAQLRFALSTADAIICASDRQRDLWTGVMLAMGRLDVATYDADPSLDRLIGVVPFGLPSEPPYAPRLSLRRRFGIAPDALVLIWGGGVWDWFDPLTIIRALGSNDALRENVRLVFMGTKPPAHGDSSHSMLGRARALSGELGLSGSAVHFNEEWVPYRERATYLMDADLGVSAHFSTAETRYSFRTRMLDYVWAGLPIMCTSGDTWSEMVERRQAGWVVPPERPDLWADLLLRLLKDRSVLTEAKSAVTDMAKELTWDVAVQPLLTMIEGQPTGSRNRAAHHSTWRSSASYWAASARRDYRRAGVQGVLRRVTQSSSAAATGVPRVPDPGTSALRGARHDDQTDETWTS